MEFLNWVRGPGLEYATVIFLIGILMRFLEMWLIGRKPDLSTPRASASRAGWRAVWRRSLPSEGLMKNSPLVLIAGYVFHIGFLLVLLFYVPHIHFFKDVLGFGWSGLPTPLINFLSILTIAALVALLVHRLIDPVRRFLSTSQDYIVWAATTLPVVTGYMAMHMDVVPYTTMLALHILSVEILMVVFPFTKLMHAFTFAVSRYYNGAAMGRKGVQL